MIDGSEATSARRRAPTVTASRKHIFARRRHVESAASPTLPQTYGKAVQWIWKPKAECCCSVAASAGTSPGVAGYLAQFRPGVIEVPSMSAESFEPLLDTGRATYRVLPCCVRSPPLSNGRDSFRRASRRARRSGRSLHGCVALRPPPSTPSRDRRPDGNSIFPYDTLAPAVAQMEALVARIVAEQPDNNGREWKSWNGSAPKHRDRRWLQAPASGLRKALMTPSTRRRGAPAWANHAAAADRFQRAARARRGSGSSGSPDDLHREAAQRASPTTERLLQAARANGVEAIHCIICQRRRRRDLGLDLRMTPIPRTIRWRCRSADAGGR